MLWDDLLLDAAFRGIPFEVLRTQDSAQRATAQYETPYIDGADVEDLGRGPHQVQLTAVFFGPGYRLRLSALLQALDQAGPGELIHPVFGVIAQAQVLQHQVSFDAEDANYCSVEISWLEATPGQPFFVLQLPNQLADAIGPWADLAQALGIEAFVAAVEAIQALPNSLPRQRGLNQVMAGTSLALHQQVPTSPQPSGLAADLPRAFAYDVVAVATTVADSYRFSPDSRRSDWQALNQQLLAINAIPAQVAGGSEASPATRAEKPLPAYPADVALVSAVVPLATATVQAQVARALLRAEAEQATLSPPDIEQISNDSRTQLQQTLEQYRTLYSLEVSRPVTEALKDGALAVQDAALAVIEQRPPLIARSVDADGNLHLLAFLWYGDYARAQELARLNPQLLNPNTLHAGDLIHGYAR